MAEKDTIFSSKIKSKGIFNFRDFYNFCHDWLEQETGMSTIAEEKYSETLKGNVKDIEVEWDCSKKVTDYFKFNIKVKFKVKNLANVEVKKENVKVKTNDGEVEVTVKGILVRDYQGKFEQTAFKKFLRGIYEKWVIVSRIDEFEDKLAGGCDEFLMQAKAYLDLEGRS